MQANLELLKPEIATASPNATNTNIETIVTIPRTRRSTPDSVALIPVSGRSHLREIIRARPVWTAYSIVHVKSMALLINQPIIPIESVGSSNRLAS